MSSVVLDTPTAADVAASDVAEDVGVEEELAELAILAATAWGSKVDVAEELAVSEGNKPVDVSVGAKTLTAISAPELEAEAEAELEPIVGVANGSTRKEEEGEVVAAAAATGPSTVLVIVTVVVTR